MPQHPAILARAKTSWIVEVQSVTTLPMALPPDVEALLKAEGPHIEWKENVADVEEVVQTLCAFANDHRNTGVGGHVVCGIREAKEHGFKKAEIAGLTSDRFNKLSNAVMTTCTRHVYPAISPSVTSYPVESDPTRRVLVFYQPATGNSHMFRSSPDESGSYYIRVGESTIQARDEQVARAFGSQKGGGTISAKTLL
ncbi:MAG: ATP-binding protein [Polyangiaceae bacterium]|nr:ATP-binding protein [Polyangiaceae bacterium]